MSGICGLFNLDDAPVANSELRAMTSMLERRGPERTGAWRDGPCGLGHTLLATTPELQFERQPFTHDETGCVITADVRLDNRVELLGTLGLSERCESIGDAELILRAYLEWDAACVDRLLGDFAFAIQDPRRQTLFCARDHFGVRPFYFHHSPRQRFVFASDARAILVLPQVPYQVDEGRVADYLVPELEWIDYTSTFYEGVFRLPPGNKVTVTASGLNIVEYWRPVPRPDPGPMSDDDYAQGFLEVFSKAVEARLRVPDGRVGSMLSGGMDSGSVVAIGKEIFSARNEAPLPTFSGVRYKDTDCSESRRIYAALDMPSISPTLVHPDALLDQYEALITDIEEPFDGEFTILKAIYLAAHQQGQRVVLDGGAGDVVLGDGTYIVRLIRQGQLKLAMAEIAGVNKFWGGGPLVSDLLRYGRAAVVPEFVKKRIRPSLQRRRAASFVNETMICRDYATRVNIAGRYERMREIFPGNWTPDYATERSNAILPNVTGGRERYARLAAGMATESRDPFLDKRVIDFCSRLPGRARLRNGWPKMILRELMADRLPDKVRWARGKPHIGWLFNAAVTRQAIERGSLDLNTLQDGLRGYVDAEALTKAWREFNDSVDTQHLHSAHMLLIWLRETVNRPVVCA